MDDNSYFQLGECVHYFKWHCYNKVCVVEVMNGNRGKALEKTTDFSRLEDDSDSSLFTEKSIESPT